MSRLVRLKLRSQAPTMQFWDSRRLWHVTQTIFWLLTLVANFATALRRTAVGRCTNLR